MNLFDSFRGGLIVSCQPEVDEPENDPMNQAGIMAALAQAAVLGGAQAIRADGPEHIAAIHERVKVALIGTYNLDLPNYAVRSTPTTAAAIQVVAAGADIIALDATARPHPEGGNIPGFIRLVSAATGKPVLADVATLEEGLAAAEGGAAGVSTAFSGYTSYSPRRYDPDFELLEKLLKALSIPVIAGGRYNTPALAKQALKAGAWAVMVGSGITRPRTITHWYVREMRSRR